MSTQDALVVGELPESKLVDAIRAALKQHEDRLDDVTTADVMDHLAVALSIDRAILKKRHKEQINQRLIEAYGQMTPPDKLSDTVYLGSEWNATNLAELNDLGIRHVVNCTLEDGVGGVPSPFSDQITYLRLEQLDDNEATLIQEWDSVHQFVKDAESEGSAVLVHCQRGISRSAATCVAFFMKEQGISKADALEYVKSRRPQILPNPKFMRELDEYEARLFEEKMAARKLEPTAS